jgi:Omp85 superfamily domain
VLPSRARMARRGTLLLALLALAGFAPPGPDEAEPEAPADPVVEAAKSAAPPKKPGETSHFALPVLFWLPETRLGFGATGGIHFRLRGAPRTSSIFVVGAYTLNQQGSADVAADVTLKSGALLAGRVRAVHFPDKFYGIGPDSPVSDAEPFTRRFVEAILAAEYPIAKRRFYGGLRAGLRLDLRAEEVLDLEPGGQLASGAIEGADGFTAVGVGGSVTWDTRDRPLFPGRGAFVQAWYLQYPEALGRHGQFSRANLEGRIFLPLGKERVLGAAAFLDEAFGDVPFTILPKLGSTRFLRGWREGRFRDKAAWAAQAELRVPLVDRVYGTTFGALGAVAPDAASFRADSIIVAGGVGLRYRLTPEGANIRLDVALSEAGPQVYVLVLEAF